jgi:hypothetical protein
VRGKMKDPKEIQIAFEIWNLTNKLNDLLWDRYAEEFLEIYLKEEDDKYLHTIQNPSLPEAQDKTED